MQNRVLPVHIFKSTHLHTPTQVEWVDIQPCFTFSDAAASRIVQHFGCQQSGLGNPQQHLSQDMLVCMCMHNLSSFSSFAYKYLGLNVFVCTDESKIDRTSFTPNASLPWCIACWRCTILDDPRNMVIFEIYFPSTHHDVATIPSLHICINPLSPHLL